MLSQQPKGQLQNQLQHSEKKTNKKRDVRQGKTDRKTNDVLHATVIKTMMGDNNQKKILM